VILASSYLPMKPLHLPHWKPTESPTRRTTTINNVAAYFVMR